MKNARVIEVLKYTFRETYIGISLWLAVAAENNCWQSAGYYNSSSA
jgi:hypothetical protein